MLGSRKGGQDTPNWCRQDKLKMQSPGNIELRTKIRVI
jgi:hypothetical protein